MLTINELNEKIIRGEVSRRDLFMMIEDEIKNDSLNIFFSTRFPQIFHELNDERFINKPFKGIPIALKNLGQNKKDEIITSGSRLLRTYKATYNDNIVRYLEDLGFIVVGYTNTPEFGFRNNTMSKMHGITRNAVNYLYHAGGSSGGAAVAVKKGIVPVSLASDGGGSIRIPASYNGLIGLKPTRGRIIGGPGDINPWRGASITFPITRTVDDTILMLDLLSIDNEFLSSSSAKVPSFRKEVKETKGRKFKITYSLKTPKGIKLANDAKEGLLDLVAKLKTLGHDVTAEDLHYDEEKLMDSYYLMNAREAYLLINRIKENEPLNFYDVEPFTFLLYQVGKDINEEKLSSLLSYWQELSNIIEKFHDEYDLFLTPTTNGVAPLVETKDEFYPYTEAIRDSVSMPFSKRFNLLKKLFRLMLVRTPFTALMNMSGHPSISLPTFRNDEGMPLGMQFSTKKDGEVSLLSIAKSLEDHHYLLIES